MNINSAQQLDKQKMRNELERHEGRVPKVYYDSMKIPTVGIGHNCEAAPVQVEIGDTLSDGHIDRLFEEDFERHLALVKITFPDFDRYPVVVREALLNMCFNLGNLGRFPQFCAVVKTMQWGMTADFLRNNFKKWYAQVKGRATEIEAKFRQAERGI